LGEIISYKEVNNIFSPNNIKELIRNMVQHVANGNMTEFSRKFDLNPGLTFRWCSGRATPEMDYLIAFSFYYETLCLSIQCVDINIKTMQALLSRNNINQ
jgi:hypothetical protein